MRRASRSIVGAAALVAVLAGCDFFRAAQPEAPTERGIIPIYTSPDATLQTIADAIADKARTIGITAYAGAFAESTSASTPGFHQFFWPTDVVYWEKTLNRDVPDDWNLTLERTFYVRFVNLRGDDYQLEWLEDEDFPDPPPGADVAILHRHYVVRTMSPEDQSITSTLAVGFADLTLVRFPDGNWRITKWEDRIDPDPPDPSDPEQVTLGRRRLTTTQ